MSIDWSKISIILVVATGMIFAKDIGLWVKLTVTVHKLRLKSKKSDVDLKTSQDCIQTHISVQSYLCMLKRTIFFILMGCFSPWALSQTFEVMPEFFSITEEDQDRIEGPQLTGPEYAGDMLAYDRTPEQHYFFLSSDKAVELNAGSLNASQFGMDSRLKLSAPFSRFFEFRLTHFQYRNLEEDQAHLIPEVVAWFNQPSESGFRLGASFYGEVDLDKRKNDTGVSILLKPSVTHEIRFFQTFVDVTREKRNNRNDTFIAPDLPRARGIVGRWYSAQSETPHFLTYAFRSESKVTWLFKDEVETYQAWRWMVGLNGRYAWSRANTLSLQFQWDRKKESKAYALPAVGSNEDWDRFRKFIRLRWDVDKLWTGIDLSLREWDMHRGELHSRDVIPFVGHRFLGFSDHDEWGTQIQLGLHRTLGPRTEFLPEDQESRGEHKLVLYYEFGFIEKSQGSFRLTITGDLDQFGTKRSWDGGQARVIFSF